MNPRESRLCAVHQNFVSAPHVPSNSRECSGQHSEISLRPAALYRTAKTYLICICKNAAEFPTTVVCLGRSGLLMTTVAELCRDLERLPPEAMVPVGWVLERLHAPQGRDAQPAEVE